MLVPLLTLLISQTQKLTAEIPALGLPAALQKLSQQVGERWLAAPVYKDEILTCALTNVDSTTLKTQIADVFFGRWQTSADGTSTLVQDPDKLKKLVRKRNTVDAEILDGSLAYLRRRLKVQGEQYGPAEYQAMLKLKAEDAERVKRAEEAKNFDLLFQESNAPEMTAEWRALASVLISMDRNSLLSLPYDSRTVWDEHPTPMQLAFGPIVQPILARYRAELAATQPDIHVDRVRIILKRWETSGAFNAEFEGRDRENKIVARGFARLANDMDRMKGLGKNQVPTLPGKTLIQVATEIRDWASLMTYNQMNKSSEVRLHAMERILDPVKFEPLERFPGELYVQCAKALHKNLLANTNDNYPDIKFVNESTSAEDALIKSQLFQETAPGWITSSFTEPITRANRTEAWRFLTKAHEQGGFSVDDAARYAGTHVERYPFVNWFGQYLRTLLTDSGPYSSGASLDEVGLRLWWALNPTNRQSLRAGQTVPISRLPAAALDQLRFRIYDQNALQNGDATDTMPNGLTDGTISLAIEEVPIMIGRKASDPESAHPMPFDAKQFGKALAIGNSYWEVDKSVYQSWDRFKLGVCRLYHLTVKFSNGAQMSDTLQETFFPPSQSELSKLPEEFMKVVARTRANTKPPVAEPGSKAQPE